MPNSVKKSLTRGDLRASKGAFIFIPEGSKQYLRVEIPNPPPADFLRASVELQLKQDVKSFLESERFGQKLSPEHGVPEQVGGALEQFNEDRWLLSNSTVAIEVQLPSAPSEAKCQALCEMSGPLVADQIIYLEEKDD